MAYESDKTMNRLSTVLKASQLHLTPTCHWLNIRETNFSGDMKADEEIVNLPEAEGFIITEYGRWLKTE